MNGQDRTDINELKIRVGNIEKSQETILKNHLPHLQDAIDRVFEIACKNSGKLWVYGIVLGVILALTVGLYFA